MQKTVRINLQARKNLLKKSHKDQIAAAKQEWNQYHQQKNTIDKKARQYVKEERANRREDWILGPLAPNRNVGQGKGTFGTIDVDLIQSPTIPKQVKGDPKFPGYDAVNYEKKKGLAFRGDTIVGNVVAGDRVVVVHGPERIRGKIGHVSSVDYDREELRIENINLADIKIPPTAPQPPASEHNPDPALYNTMEMPIPMTHVRLIAAMDFHDNGILKDVIVRHVHAAEPYGQRSNGSNIPAHTRYITGSAQHSPNGKDIVIPWPEENIENVFKHSEPDTVRDVVEKDTWLPGVLNDPLGYHFEVGENTRLAGQPTAAYTLGLVTNRQEADNKQRAGLSGFVHQDKLDVRRTRIARGILDELRPKAQRAKALHDDSEWVKRKMLEDARAIWWRDRKVLSPVAEAAERALQERRRQKEEQLNKEFGEVKPTIWKAVAIPTMAPVSQQMRLPVETRDLIKSMQAASLKTKYNKPDTKFSKRLTRMA